MNLLDFFRKKPSSGSVAKDRLQLLLVSDRSACSPEMMQAIRDDIIAVISKYMDVDLDDINIELTTTEVDGSRKAVPTLYANIPIKDVKRDKGTQS